MVLIKILSELNAIKYIKKNNVDCIISIYNPIDCFEAQEYYNELETLMKSKSKSYHNFQFRDTIDRNHDGAPTIDIINDIENFANNIKDLNYSSFLFHCGGGISRSPAVAMIFMNILGLNDELREHLRDKNPNSLILKLKKIRKIN